MKPRVTCRICDPHQDKVAKVYLQQTGTKTVNLCCADCSRLVTQTARLKDLLDYYEVTVVEPSKG